MRDAAQPELRWHLALTTPRLSLTAAERRRACSVLQAWLDDPSSIVKTCVLQGLADLARGDTMLVPEIVDLLRDAERNGTPAMRARSRMLLPRLELRQCGES